MNKRKALPLFAETRDGVMQMVTDGNVYIVGPRSRYYLQVGDRWWRLGSVYRDGFGEGPTDAWVPMTRVPKDSDTWTRMATPVPSARSNVISFPTDRGLR